MPQNWPSDIVGVSFLVQAVSCLPDIRPFLFCCFQLDAEEKILNTGNIQPSCKFVVKE